MPPSPFRAIVMTGALSVVPLALATIAAQAAAGTGDAAVFRRVAASVFAVETETGLGTGFLVDASGLVLTNDHVVGDSLYLAVGIDPARKFAAQVVARDARRDLAVLAIPRCAIDGTPVLALAGCDVEVAAGDRVLALAGGTTPDGTVLTSGIVSRVEADLIVADLAVNAGSSGGPLVDQDGRVLGVNTFWLRTPAGPGLAGAVRAHVAADVLERARRSAPSDSPPCERLPVASATPYPANALRALASTPTAPSGYSGKVGDVGVDVLTPPRLFRDVHGATIRQLAAARPPHDADTRSRPLYEWHATVGGLEPIVGIRVAPAGGRGGHPVGRLRLLRCGTEVTPIVPGRDCSRASQSGGRPARDACAAFYQYQPEAFAPGGTLELRIEIGGARPQIRTWKLPAKVVERIWSDFEPYFAMPEPSRLLATHADRWPRCR